MKKVSILGATGSIGSSTLNVIRHNPEKFMIHSVVAQKNVAKMITICQEFRPHYAVMADETAAKELAQELKNLKLPTKVFAGEAEILAIVQDVDVDVVVAAIVGAKGFLSSLAAVQAGKTVLLANKETLVMGGKLFMDEVATHKATIYPIDSEHNALFQCLPKENGDQGKNGATLVGVRKLILTASGGPFRTYTKEMLQAVTLEQALKHPNWDMGPKVTIDSSTLMNKGLEFIEAHFLFNMPPEDIEVLVHPQSIIHSLVEYQDGSFLAQLGEADMSIPIAYALGYPERILSGAKRLDLAAIATLNFETPDLDRFPCLHYAKAALLEGESHLVALNAVNEVLVEAFLLKQIHYTQISTILGHMLESLKRESLTTVDDLLSYDRMIREKVRENI